MCWPLLLSPGCASVWPGFQAVVAVALQCRGAPGSCGTRASIFFQPANGRRQDRGGEGPWLPELSCAAQTGCTSRGPLLGCYLVRNRFARVQQPSESWQSFLVAFSRVCSPKALIRSLDRFGRHEGRRSCSPFAKLTAPTCAKTSDVFIAKCSREDTPIGCSALATPSC